MHTQALTKKYVWQKIGQWFGIHKKHALGKKNISLWGILGDVEITEQEINEARYKSYTL